MIRLFAEVFGHYRMAAEHGLLFFPIFGIIGAGVAFTLAIKSWLHFRRKR